MNSKQLIKPTVLKIFLLLFSILALTAQSSASAKIPSAKTKAKLLDVQSWEDVKTLFEGKDLKTVDQFIASIPKEFMRGYSLIYSTRALNGDYVTPRTPRVILFGKTGQFMLSYNSHPSGKEAAIGTEYQESVETIEFKKDGQTLLREIAFDGITPPNLDKVVVNPNKCTTCHGSGLMARGLWDPYNMWPGVYGSLSRGGMDFIAQTKIDPADGSKSKTLEFEGFQSFLAEKKTNPRYKSLPLHVGEYLTLSQWHDKVTSTTYKNGKTGKLFRPFDPKRMNDGIVITDGYTTLPNQMIGMFIGEHNFRRIGLLFNQFTAQQKKALSYLIAGLKYDERYFKIEQTDASGKNTTVIREGENPRDAKTYTCFKMIDKFLPKSWLARMPKFPQFHDDFISRASQEFVQQKQATEMFNNGLARPKPLLPEGEEIPDDVREHQDALPFRFQINVDLEYDPVAFPMTWPRRSNSQISGSEVLVYILELLGMNGYNQNTVMTGMPQSTNFYYGNESTKIQPGTEERPFNITGFDETVERFFSTYLSTDYDLDNSEAPEFKSKHDKKICENLAARSKKALESAGLFQFDWKKLQANSGN